jgi:hypothetical protein
MTLKKARINWMQKIGQMIEKYDNLTINYGDPASDFVMI